VGGSKLVSLGEETMNAYRVKVESYVVVNARNEKDAKAVAELAVRHAIAKDYRETDLERWADGWEGFGFLATGKPAKVVNDEI
jgi:hypothetical protein